MKARESASTERRTTSARVPGPTLQKCLCLPMEKLKGFACPNCARTSSPKDWVILATEPANRPEEMATHRAVQAIPEFVESCPFCSGNEDKTPNDVLAESGGGECRGNWCGVVEMWG